MVLALVIHVFATPRQIKVIILVIDRRYCRSKVILNVSCPIPFSSISSKISNVTVHDICNILQVFSLNVEANQLFANERTHKYNTEKAPFSIKNIDACESRIIQKIVCYFLLYFTQQRTSVQNQIILRNRNRSDAREVFAG